MSRWYQKNLQRGDAMEGVLVLIFLSIIVFVFIIPNHSQGPLSNPLFTTSPSGSGGSTGPHSYYSLAVTLGSGTGPSSYEPAQEYITLTNNSNTSVDITGWKLQNGKGQRTYSVGGNDTHFPSDTVYIPKGANLPTGLPATDIILAPGDQALVTTGTVSNSYPFKISSFKENECTSYLADTDTYSYTFSPYLYSSCIVPSQEVGAANLDITCQNFVNSLQSCRSPKFDSVDYQGHARDGAGNTCNGCVNGVGGLSNSCQAFLRQHFSYQGCIANHQNDPSFYGKTWHIYLGQTWELWAADHDTISLYDRSGNLVDSLKY